MHKFGVTEENKEMKVSFENEVIGFCLQLMVVVDVVFVVVI